MNQNNIDKISRLIDANEKNELVIFVGSGVSINSGYPSWSTVVKKMGKSLGLDINNLDSTDYLKIPEIMFYRNKNKYKRIIQDSLDLNKKPNDINNLISMLRPDQIITTNYDNLIEKSLQANRLSTSYGVVYDDKSFMEQGKKKNHFVVKMHGDIKHLDSIVLKEKDYLDFESNKPMISNFINNLLSTRIFLFIGYSLSDNTLKMIINKISNFRRKMNVTDLPKNVMAGFFNEDKYSYSLESNYYSQRDVELFNLDDFKIHGENEKKNKLKHFMNIINESDAEGILAEYSNQNYISYNEINNYLNKISDEPCVEDEVEDVNVVHNNKIYKSFFNDNDDNLKQTVLNKTMNYKVSKVGTDKIKLIKSNVDDDIYNMIISCRYDKLYDYYQCNKGSMNANEYYFLYDMIENQFSSLPLHVDDGNGSVSQMILSNNKKHFNIQNNYLELSPKQIFITDFVRKVIDGRVINNVLYEKLYNESKNKYGIDIGFHMFVDGNHFYDNKYGTLRYSRKIALDLYRYTLINRIIDEGKNINVYKLFLNCILLTYHKDDSSDYSTRYANDYKLTALDIDTIVKNISFSTIINVLNERKIEYLQINDIHNMVDAFVNLCNSYNYLQKNKIEHDLGNEIIEYIKSYILFISLCHSLDNSDLEKIYDGIYSLKVNLNQEEVYLVFEKNFLAKLGKNNYLEFSANRVLVDKLVDMKNCAKVLPEYDYAAFRNIRKIIKRENYNLNVVKNNFNSNDVDPNYLCFFLPMIYTKKEIEASSEWIINVLKKHPIFFIILICNENLLKNKINDMLKKAIDACYVHNTCDSNTQENIFSFLTLKSLGARVFMPKVLKLSENDMYPLNRLISFVLEDKRFDFCSIDLTKKLWQRVLLDDIRYKRFRLVSILKLHLNEIISEDIIHRFKMGKLSQNEMIILYSLGVDINDLYKY